MKHLFVFLAITGFALTSCSSVDSDSPASAQAQVDADMKSMMAAMMQDSITYAAKNPNQGEPVSDETNHLLGEVEVLKQKIRSKTNLVDMHREVTVLLQKLSQTNRYALAEQILSHEMLHQLQFAPDAKVNAQITQVYLDKLVLKHGYNQPVLLATVYQHYEKQLSDAPTLKKKIIEIAKAKSGQSQVEAILSN